MRQQLLPLPVSRLRILIGASPKEIIFTGGGSEGDNTLIKGVAHANVKKGRHIITTQVEHHAVLHTCEELAKEGFEITYLPVDEWQGYSGQVEGRLTRRYDPCFGDVCQ